MGNGTWFREEFFGGNFLSQDVFSLALSLEMSDEHPYVIPEMDPTLRKQMHECNWQVVNVTTPANYFHVLQRLVSVFNSLKLYEFAAISSSSRFAFFSHSAHVTSRS